jgi:hypothetical protein
MSGVLNLDANTHTIQRMISEHCAGMRNRILVHSFDSPYSHHTLGKQFYIDFSSYPDNPGQYEIVPYEENPLVGQNIQYSSESIIEYGKNLMFWPIPFEMLETYEEKPQMIVEVDHMPAVCHSMDCGFMHIAAVGEVTSFTYSASTKKVTVTGTNLPDNIGLLQSMRFAASPCTPIEDASGPFPGALSGTSIECTLTREPTCGTWIPEVTTFFGNVPNAEAVTGLEMPCTISSADPLLDLNMLGQDIVTFTGTNFPHEMMDNTFDIKFSNTD